MSLARPIGYWGSGGAASTPLLVSPTVLDSGSTSETSDNIVSGAISPPPNALLLCSWGHRHSSDRTVQTPILSGLNISGSWRILQAGIQHSSGDMRWIRSAILMARMAASPGTGTIQFNASANVWQKIYTVNQVATGFDFDLDAYPSVTNTGESTSLALNLGSAPAASSLIFSALAEVGNVSTAFTVPSGHTELTRVQAGSSLDLKDSFKLLDGSQNNSWTNLNNGQADAGVLVEVLQR